MIKKMLFSSLLFMLPAAVLALEDNPILHSLYQADQRERIEKEVDWNALTLRDRERFIAVRKFLADGKINTAADYLAAATILNHGADLPDFRLAVALAELGLALQPESQELKRLYAAAWDRMMVARGRLQWYATQYVKEGNAPWKLLAVDPLVTDAQRLAMGRQSLADMQEKIAKLNQDEPVRLPAVAMAATTATFRSEVFLAKKPDTMRLLLEKDAALGQFWLILSEFGLRQPLRADAPVAMKTSFVKRENKEILAIIEGEQAYTPVSNGNDACFFEYEASVDSAFRLTLNLSFDCKVKPGPKLTINPDQHYRMVLSGLGQDLKGRDLQLVELVKLQHGR